MRSPKLHAIVPPTLPLPVEEKLAQDTALLMHNQPGQSLLKVEVILEVSNVPFSSIYAYLAAKMLKEGTVTKSHQDITEILELCGAHLKVHLNADHFTLELLVLASYAPPAIALLFEILQEVRFSKDRLDHVRALIAQKLTLKTAQNSYLSFQRFKRTIFGSSHPYGWSVLRQDLERVDANALQHHYNTAFLVPRYVLLSGCVTESCKQDIKRRFGALTLAQSPLPLQKPRVRTAQNIRQNAPNALQASILLGRVLPKASHRDYISLLIANQAIGGYFGARLVQIIREKLGYTYSISSHITVLKQSSYWWLYTETSTQIAQKAYREIQNQLERLCTRPITKQELHTVKQHILGEYIGRVHDPFWTMSKIKNVRLHHLPSDHYAQLADAVACIEAADIRRITQSYFSPTALTSVITSAEYPPAS